VGIKVSDKNRIHTSDSLTIIFVANLYYS